MQFASQNLLVTFAPCGTGLCDVMWVASALVLTHTAAKFELHGRLRDRSGLQATACPEQQTWEHVHVKRWPISRQHPSSLRSNEGGAQCSHYGKGCRALVVSAPRPASALTSLIPSPTLSGASKPVIRDSDLASRTPQVCACPVPATGGGGRDNRVTRCPRLGVM